MQCEEIRLPMGAGLCCLAICLLPGRQDPGFTQVSISMSDRASLKVRRGSCSGCHELRISVSTLVFTSAGGSVRSNTSAAILITVVKEADYSMAIADVGDTRPVSAEVSRPPASFKSKKRF